VELALSDGPRGVVCDLTSVVEDAEPVAVEGLATLGRNVRDWPGTPVAVACPDPLVRATLTTHPLGRHLIVTESLFSAVSAVLATPTWAVARLHLAPHPTALRASRDFVTRTMLDWRLGPVIRFARLVIGELVMNSMVSTGTDIDVSVAWDRGALRLTVRDHDPVLLDQQSSALGLYGRALSVVSGLSRAFGVLPTADGGTVIWAVLDAARPHPSINRPLRKPATAIKESPGFVNALSQDGLPICGETGLHRSGHRVPRPPSGASAQ